MRLPVEGEEPVVLAAADTWPRSKDVFCMLVAEWPDQTEVLEDLEALNCWRSGKAVHLVLNRSRLRRSMFVFTTARGRPAIFWRTATSMHGARPGVRAPAARGLEQVELVIAVDSRERYGWRFRGRHLTLEKRALPVGDYALLQDEVCVAVVERKTVADLCTSAVSGTLGLALMELTRVPRAALVIEGRLSDVVKAASAARVQPGWILNLVASLQVAHPTVQWMFAETRTLAEDWAYRWLAAAAARSDMARDGAPRLQDARGRRARALADASRSAITAAEHAVRSGIGTARARRDLADLVREGHLVAQRAGRTLEFRAVKPPPGGSAEMADAEVTLDDLA
ncbi:MAG: hypothetical protein M3010_02135 [Candidatus Dormibacteraeota bacterium]|nr:hypothetical protein [Candidatus Dormibacteraeota bacterium]